MNKSIKYYIGWDVGGWNCDNNSNSRDAIVILNENFETIGTPWRGNLTETIYQSKTTDDFLKGLWKLCKAEKLFNTNAEFILAIDTPLGYSDAFKDLINNYGFIDSIGVHAKNPYLFRHTEKFLFEKGISPLSSVKDMIGSQSTKGIQVLAKFAPNILSCGVWTDNKYLKVIEAYPSPARKTKFISEKLISFKCIETSKKAILDSNDAFICAVIAWLFKNNIDRLYLPTSETSLREGWIWTIDVRNKDL